jgi:hypothetical protein
MKNLRRLAPLFVLVSLFLLTTPPLRQGSVGQALSSVHAQTDSLVYPQKPVGNLLFGQKHAYTVVFRNDGAATILGRIVFKNTDKDPIRELTLTIPGADVSDPIFYQISAQPQCIEYRPVPVDDSSDSCLVSSVDYLYCNFEYFGNEAYTKIVPGQDGGTFTIPLATEITENQPGGIVFAYRSRGLTQESWSGTFRFTFTSPQVPSPIELIRVAVGVDSDLYLKGSQSKVAYKEEAPAVTDLAATSIGRVIDYYQRQGFTKEGRNLGSGESLVVVGSYADSWWNLYAMEIVWSLVGVAAAVLLWLLWRRYYHPVRQRAGPFTGIFSPGNVGIAFGSALATVGLTYLGTVLLPIHIRPYQDPVFSVLFSILILGLYALILFGPAFWIAFGKIHEGKEQAWKHFLCIIVVELLSLAILLTIYVSIVPRSEMIPLPYATTESGAVPGTRFVE